MERLQKVIAASGITSRRKAEDLIKTGKVIVNGNVVTELGTKVSGNDDIIVNGVSIKKEDYVYFILNKPHNVICSVNDEHNRVTVVDLIETDKRIYPIGRLDFDTTGLLLLTNDGELANILMHPSNGVSKKYVAKLDNFMAINDLKTLKGGIVIDGIKCLPERVKIKKNDVNKNTSTVEITITEGRNHIVKKLFESLGYKVIKLNRSEYGFLNVNDLKCGEYRPLTIKEVKKLYGYKS
jgi:23S rRNA pseudouridine2605 synthase